jgi:hypothetical protein
MGQALTEDPVHPEGRHQVRGAHPDQLTRMTHRLVNRDRDVSPFRASERSRITDP